MKDRKAKYRENKVKTQRRIIEIYHKNDGVPGYRMMCDYLRQEKVIYSYTTIHKYMKELGLHSIVRPKRPAYIKGQANKVFPDLLNRNFKVDRPNRIWATDFTYLRQPDGSMRYNCSIIDLHERIVVATLNGSHITAQLAINTLRIAVERHNPRKGLILHSDQGSQFTSKEFNEFCEKSYIQQSMSHAGCPYDNAPMERFYNTLKNEFYNIYSFNSVADLDQRIYEFIYIKYNHQRPHSFNGGLTPYAARCSA